MKALKLIILLLFPAVLQAQETVSIDTAEAMPKEIFVLDEPVEKLKTGDTATGRLEAGGIHWYRIYAKTNGMLVFETTVNSDTDPDTNIDIDLYYEEAGHLMLVKDDDKRQDDYASLGYRWRINLKTQGGMTYCVKVQGYDNSVTGSYKLQAHYIKKFSVLDGTVTFELSESRGDFHCIGMRFSDDELNMGYGTYMEIKKRREYYLMHQWKGKKYTNMNDGIEDVLKEHFTDFYKGELQDRGKKAWAAFVEEGGLQLFIDFVNEMIDDEFLNSPFNEIYG
jgi:hypothetical protein